MLNDLAEFKSKKTPSIEEVTNLLRIFIRIAKYNEGKIKTQEALELYSEALAIASDSGIFDTIELAYIKQGIGAIYLSQGNVGEAETFLDSASKTFEATLSSSDSRHPLIQTLCLQAAIYNKQGKFDEAQELLKSVLHKINDLGDKKMARSMLVLAYDGLGSVHYKKNELPEAIEYWKNGLDLAVKEMGDDSIEAKGFYELLAKAFYDQRKFSESMEYAEKYLTASMNHYGEDSPLMSASLSLVGELHYKQESYDEAIEMYQRILNLLENSAEKNPNPLIDTYMLMAKTYFYQGEMEEANNYFEKAKDTSLEAFGSPNIKLADCYTVWAEVLRFKSETKADAKSCYNKALEIYKSLNVVDEARIIDIYAYLGEVYYLEDDLEEALKRFKECLDLSLKANKPNRLEEAYSFLGSIYLKKKDYDKAVDNYKKAVEACQDLENSSKKLHFHYHNLGEVYERKGSVEEASDVYKKALDFDREEFGNDDSKTQKSLNNVLRMQAQLDDRDNEGKDS